MIKLQMIFFLLIQMPIQYTCSYSRVRKCCYLIITIVISTIFTRHYPKWPKTCVLIIPTYNPLFIWAMNLQRVFANCTAHIFYAKNASDGAMIEKFFDCWILFAHLLTDMCQRSGSNAPSSPCNLSEQPTNASQELREVDGEAGTLTISKSMLNEWGRSCFLNSSQGCLTWWKGL